jgi:hypothetical protein
MIKKTLIGLAVIGMMLATILPLNALATTASADVAKACSTELGRSTVRGFALRIGQDSTGRYARLFAIRLHFVTVTVDGHHENGVIWLKKVEIPARNLGFHGRFYIYASFIGTIQQYP